MPRKPRDLQPDYCYHVTVRCNNREFHLASKECREVLLYAIKKAQEKYGFTLYALCIMSNHIHYLIEPKVPEDLPQIMHWLNWYTAMCFNRMLNRKGHFWEQRYHSSGFHRDDKQRALNSIRYIHANPVIHGLVDEVADWPYSNYPEWVGEREGTLVDGEFVRAQFPVAAEYRAFVVEWLADRRLPKALARYLGTWES